MKIKKYIKAARGSVEEMLDAFESRIDQLQNLDNVELSTDIESCDLKEQDWSNSTQHVQAATSAQPAREFQDYRDFAETLLSEELARYPKTNLEAEQDEWDELEMEIEAVEDALRDYSTTLKDCPTYWREDYEYPIIDINGDYYFIEFLAGRELRAGFYAIDQFSEYSTQEACDELGLPKAIWANADINSSSQSAKYVLEDSFGAPQAGADIKYFDEWYEVEEYLEENPDVEERIFDGYAVLSEVK